jgi:hypothetical protein
VVIYPFAPAVTVMMEREAEIGFRRDEMEWWKKKGKDNGSQWDKNGQRRGRDNYGSETKVQVSILKGSELSLEIKPTELHPRVWSSIPLQLMQISIRHSLPACEVKDDVPP